MKKDELARIIVLIVAAILAILVIRPFILVLILASIAAYALYPLHKKIHKFIPRLFSALFITTSSLALLVFIVQYGTNIALREIGRAYSVIANFDFSAISPHLETIIRKLIEYSASWFSNQILAVPDLVIGFTMFFIAMFYLLYDGHKIYNAINKLVPLPRDERDDILLKIKRSINSFIYVQLTIGFLQGVIAAIGFYIFGIEYIFFGAMFAAILSILPMMGSFILYSGIAIFFMLTGHVLLGVGFLIYGVGLSGTLDIIIKPILFGKKSQIHPLITFIGVFGGLKVLGVAGVILGPVIISIAVTLFSEFMQGYKREIRGA